jgi:hypothetical protein
MPNGDDSVRAEAITFLMNERSMWALTVVDLRNWTSTWFFNFLVLRVTFCLIIIII